MRQDAGSSWTPFTARQTISTGDCSFDWRARLGPAGVVHVRDALCGGVGRVAVRALGLIPLANTPASAELTHGELLRYLAELAWAPDAILRNEHLRWQVIADGHFTVAVELHGVPATLQLQLDDEGRIGAVFAPDRPRMVHDRFEPTPWRGWFDDYAMFDGTWAPRKGRVGWDLGPATVICWEGSVERWWRD